MAAAAHREAQAEKVENHDLKKKNCRLLHQLPAVGFSFIFSRAVPRAAARCESTPPPTAAKF